MKYEIINEFVSRYCNEQEMISVGIDSGETKNIEFLDSSIDYLITNIETGSLYTLKLAETLYAFRFPLQGVYREKINNFKFEILTDVIEKIVTRKMFSQVDAYFMLKIIISLKISSENIKKCLAWYLGQISEDNMLYRLCKEALVIKGR